MVVSITCTSCHERKVLVQTDPNHRNYSKGPAMCPKCKEADKLHQAYIEAEETGDYARAERLAQELNVLQNG